MLKVHAAVEVQQQLASSSYLKLRKLTLIGLMGFLPGIYAEYLWVPSRYLCDNNRIKVGCTCA